MKVSYRAISAPNSHSPSNPLSRPQQHSNPHLPRSQSPIRPTLPAYSSADPTSCSLSVSSRIQGRATRTGNGNARRRNRTRGLSRRAEECSAKVEAGNAAEGAAEEGERRQMGRAARPRKCTGRQSRTHLLLTILTLSTARCSLLPPLSASLLLMLLVLALLPDADDLQSDHFGPTECSCAQVLALAALLTRLMQMRRRQDNGALDCVD